MQVRSHQFRHSGTRIGSTEATIIAVVACLALVAAGGYFYQRTTYKNMVQDEQLAAQAAGLEPIQDVPLRPTSDWRLLLPLLGWPCQSGNTSRRF